MNKTLTKKTDTQGNSGLLPYPVISAAVSGNVDAINTVLKHFEGYIAKLSTRTMYDEAGTPICALTRNCAAGWKPSSLQKF